MPPQYSLISSSMVMPAGASFDTWVFDAATHTETAQTFSAMSAKTGEPVCTFLQDISDPIQGFEVVL
jgi:hypothetical protein